MRVVVVGAGVFGAWTAHHVRASGATVTLVEAYGAAHPRSSSGDETRIVRCGYGPDAIYSQLAQRSLQQWRALSERIDRPDPLWHRAGVLWLAAGTDEYTDATRQTLARLEMPSEILSPADLRARFPHIDAEGIDLALYEPDCGVVAARRAVRALVAELQQGGVQVMVARVAAPETSRVKFLHGEHGPQIEGERFVFACGAWMPKLFPRILQGRIRPTRQVVTYFGTPAGDQRFTAANFPAWIDFPSGIYGTPDIDGRGVKVGIDEHGGPIDPDTDDRLAGAEAVARTRAWLARRVPALAGAPIVETRVCAYENTSTGDFLIDRHPSHDNVWIVGGGSGHGFKHGPAVGELAARLVLADEQPDARFALAGKTTDERRAIY
jgi:glycine/D-amino acid oxidase-like deaminating enzyme